MSASRIERRLAAILAADVVSYSRLMGADEVGTLTALKSHRAALIDPVIAAHRGRIVKTTGDGLLVEFASIVDAVAAAVAIQRAMLARNADVPVERRIVLRIGINVGDIIIDGDDIFGDGVNVAARLEALCDPGGVCISRAANDQVRDKLALAFADRGEQVVKNIARAVGVFGLTATDIAGLPEEAVPHPDLAPEPPPLTPTPRSPRGAMLGGIAAVTVIVLGLAGTWYATHPAPAPTQTPRADRRLSIVVLPFSGADDAALATGLTRDITERLASVPLMPVIAADRAASYRDTATATLRRELDVHFALSGTARLQDGKLIATAALIDTADDSKLWTERITLPDLPAARAEAAERIASSAALAANDAEAAHAMHDRPTGLDARDVLISAHISALQPATRANRTTQLALAERAVALDPAFTQAAIAVASLRVLLLRNDWSTDRTADLAKAQQEVEALMATRPRDPDVLAAKAGLQMLDGNPLLAVATNRQIVAIAPDRWEAHRDIGVVLFSRRDWRAALDSLVEARRLAPGTTGGFVLDSQLAAAFLANGDFLHAAETASRAIAQGPPRGAALAIDRAWITLVAAQGASGQEAAARATLHTYLASDRTLRTIDAVQRSRINAATPFLIDGLRKAGMDER